MLAVIVGLAFAIRIFMLDRAPVGALIDEAHFGYLAYSLNLTGQDEHGVAYPVLFTGFGDQKLPMAAYLMMPVVKLFGLSNETIRYPSILAGTLLVIAMYWLMRELGFRERWGLLAALITALSPWTFFLSRFGFESNLALFWFAMGLVFFVKMTKSAHWLWPLLAGFSLGLTWYAYIAYRPITLVLAVMILGYHIFYEKNRLVTAKQLGFFSFPFLLLISVWFHPAISKANTARFDQVGILQDPGIVMVIDENRTFCDWRFPRRVCDAVWNKPVVVGQILFSRFFHTFSPQYLATEGEVNETFLTVAGYGQFAHLLYPFFILGLGFLIFSPLKKLPFSVKLFIALGLLWAAMPGLLVGEPQKVRISALFPFLVITIILGIKSTFDWLPQPWQRYLLLGGLIIGLGVQTKMYLVNYYSVHTVKAEYSYQSYVPELMTFVKEQANEDTLINIVPFFSDPLMFYAYYTAMNPADYQKQAILGELEASGFQHTVELNRIWSKKITPGEFGCQGAKLNQKRLLYVTDQTLDGLSLIKEIKATNGVHTYVKIYEVPVQVCR